MIVQRMWRYKAGVLPIADSYWNQGFIQFYTNSKTAGNLGSSFSGDVSKLTISNLSR